MASLSTSTFPLVPRATWDPWAGGEAPPIQADPDTELPCYMWQNGDEKTCEETLEYWNMTPEQMMEWNPSVGLDCKPWRSSQSYCVVPVSRTETTASGEAPESTTTSTISFPTSSPTGWESIGCYEAASKEAWDFEKVTVEEYTLTIEKCQDACFGEEFLFAGLMQGESCWCAHYIRGDRKLKATGCNATCSGDDSEICGGDRRFSMYESKFDEGVEENESGESEGQDGEEGGEANASESDEDEESSGSRYRPFFGML